MAGERTPHECEDWLRATFDPLGVSRIDTWPDLNERDLEELTQAGGLYIGGGNTFRLLDELQRANAREILLAVQSSLPIYGGSAGAAVLGATIETICHLDPNDVGLETLTAMDLLGGASVWVHYEPADHERIEEFLRRQDETLLFALPTDGGVVVDGQSVRSAGFSASRIMGSHEIELAPGEAVRL